LGVLLMAAADHPYYKRWAGMVGRCHNPNDQEYHRYGARGITVVTEWRESATFLAYLDAELGPCPTGWSLDRIDTNGNYEPGNIRWASAATQRRNQRRVEDLTDKTVGRWTVLGRDPDRWSYWLCRCNCGIARSVRGVNLMRAYRGFQGRGRSTSCGCAKREHPNWKKAAS